MSAYHSATCETCKAPVYDWGHEDAHQGGYCRDCCAGICAAPGCAAIAPEPDETVIDGLCWDCASLVRCPEFPKAVKAANRAMVA